MDENLKRYCELTNKFVICNHFDEEIFEDEFYILLKSETDNDIGIWGKNNIEESFCKIYNYVNDEVVDGMIKKYKNFSNILENRRIIEKQNNEYEIAKEKDTLSIPDYGGVVHCRIIIFNGDSNLEYKTGCDTTIEDVNSFLSKKYNLRLPNPKNRKYIGGLGTINFLSMTSNKFKDN